MAEKEAEKGLTAKMQETLKDKKKMNYLAIFLLGVVEVVILVFMIYTAFHKNISISQTVAMELILLWFGILIGYLAWAVYFYNINFGLTNQDWAEIREKNKDSEHVHGPDCNPNHEQTLGLPKGTIRGATALTMLIGGLAMVIYSFGLETDYRESSFIVDHLEFFKDAFLMMIAFYFGNKSLEAFGKKEDKDEGKPTPTPTPEKPKNPNIPDAPTNSDATGIKRALGATDDESDKEDSDFSNPNAIG